MWIARDKNGELCIFQYKPVRNEEAALWMFSALEDLRFEAALILRSELFPKVTWESEPKWTRLLNLDWIDYKRTGKRSLEDFFI